MNNPENIVIDEAEQRAWLKEHKDSRGLSWSDLAPLIGMPQGTLSPWMGGTYAGKTERVAKAVFRYRQTLESQEKVTEEKQRAGLDKTPGYIVTPTANRLRTLMIMAHQGEITVGATGPGTGKTMTVRDYQSMVSNVWLVTMRPTTRTLPAMVAEVLRTISGKAPTGWVRQMSTQVQNLVAGKNGLLVIDEANHLEFEPLEELRAWHDATGVGICLLGNEELIARIRGGGSKHALARLNGRIAMSHVQDLPLEGDIEAYLDAWGITKPEQRAMLSRVALTPGAGGLREIRQIVTHALLLATDDGVDLSVTHLRDALSTRSTRMLRVNN